MPFRLRNETVLPTAGLKALVARAIQERGAEGILDRIVFWQTRRQELESCAWCDDGCIEVFLPKDFHLVPDWKSLSQQLVHELDHLLGLDHIDMHEWWDLDVPWAQEQALASFGTWVELES